MHGPIVTFKLARRLRRDMSLPEIVLWRGAAVCGCRRAERSELEGALFLIEAVGRGKA
jgi:hypothetical protein